MGSLDFIKPIAHLLPEVKAPERPPNLNERLMWTGVAILIFFVMYNVAAVGVSSQLGTLDFLSVVTAARLGSLVTTGIGPIVLASIFLQLFVGAIMERADPLVGLDNLFGIKGLAAGAVPAGV